MSWYYRDCPVCSDGSGSGQREGKRPAASLLLFVSTLPSVSHGPRVQKSSGSQVLCADCIAKICDGEPLPQKLRDGIAEACKVAGIRLQRALPLSVKPKRGKK